MAIQSKFHLARFKPAFNGAEHATAYAGGDVLFDWHALEIPRGGCAIRSIAAIVQGTNGAAANDKNMSLIFAKSIDGVAPPALPVSNTALAVANAVLIRKHIVGYKFLAATEIRSTNAEFVGYSILADGMIDKADDDEGHVMGAGVAPIILEGDPNYSGTTKGYQTIWVAGIAAEGGADFGTAMEIDNGSGYTSGATATLNCDGTAGDILFAPGDELVAADGAAIGTVSTISDDGSHTTLVLTSNVAATLTDDDEVCFKTPIELMLGLESVSYTHLTLPTNREV